MQTNQFPTLVGSRPDRAAGAGVSVVIPAYNAAAHIAATLKSVFDQSLAPGEIIVVDDGSTDDTVAIASSFGVRVISVSNGGPSAARNVGVQEARGEFIAFLDADDLWAPEKIESQLAAHHAYAADAFSFTDYRIIDERGVRPRKSELDHHWAFRRAVGKVGGQATIVIVAGAEKPVLYDSYIPPSAVMVRRDDYLAVGGFDETLRVAEDFEFYLRLFKRVPALAVVKPMLFYRRHTQQASANGAVMKAGLFDVARRVAAAPDRYPAADARYIGGSEYLRYYVMGMEQARVGEFAQAIDSFEKSLADRWNLRAWLAVSASRLCRTGPANAIFAAVRALWRSRKKFRST